MTNKSRILAVVFTLQNITETEYLVGDRIEQDSDQTSMVAVEPRLHVAM